MPAKKRKDGTYKDIAHPLNTDMRARMERVILDQYERSTARLGRGLAPTSRRRSPHFHIGPLWSR